MKTRYFLMAVFLITLSFEFIFKSTISAVSPPSLGVSPALQSIVLERDQQNYQYKLSISNSSNQEFSVSTTAKDFNTFGLSNGLSFISSNQPDPHGLASSLSFLPSAFILSAHSTKTVVVTINNSGNLSNGGHYTAVLYTAAPTAAPSHNLNFHQVIGSIIFVTTNGQGTYSIKLLPITLNTALFSFPSSVNLVFKNTGNVQTIARGYMYLTGPNGTEISKTILNPSSSLVLPDSERLLQTPILAPGSRLFWPGRYTLRIYYQYGGATSYHLMTYSFLYLNIRLLLTVLFVLIILGLVIRHIYFSVRKFKKNSMQK